MTALLNPSGRLIHYVRKTGKMRVVLDNLWFANGVAISPDEDFVVVADTHASRIMKVWLKGDKKGKSEVFIDGLPGAPDNLTYDADGIWFPLATAADKDHPMVPHKLAPYPTARRFLVRLLELIKMPFEKVNAIYPNAFTNFVVREFYAMDMISFIIPARRTVIRVNWDGKIVRSLHGSDATGGIITHVMKPNEYLYLGTVTGDFISRVKL